ncbi:TetR/AcrR family transcriptional regulator [Sphingomonas bacterium]|uniref:TetR/AcrR family transcriptional regulator n=1 Tax=Sphingomonas bacterium TaxID=1895847 RepID=UPI001575AEFD|nr:TetR/AcrR family transcriptional regulator [Sphingomonas bacterium]
MSHNLLGQRLGRKGQETRERILRAALCLLGKPQQDAPITLSGVAREASVGMTTLYLYFPDLGALVLAALRRVMDSADDAFIDRLRGRWPDERLEESCLDFLRAHYRFWRRHARILHMRNNFADEDDARFVEYRNRMSFPLIGLLARQMDGNPRAGVDGDPGSREQRAVFLATVLLTGFERLATVITTTYFRETVQEQGVEDEAGHVDRMLCAQARLIALGIRDIRATAD